MQAWEVVRSFVRKTKVKKANGIEFDIKRFLISIENTRDELSKNDLKRIDLWYLDYLKFDFTDATIIYNGLDVVSPKRSFKKELKKYQTLKEGTKIITRDFPFVGYEPIKAFRDDELTWFFMMKTPLEDYRVKNFDEWTYEIFKRKNVTVTQLIKYYDKAYDKRGIDLYRKDADEFRRDFIKLARRQFESKINY